MATASALVAGLLAVLPSPALATVTFLEWPQFQGSAGHAGAVISSAIKPPLKRVWRFDDVEGSKGLSGPVVHGTPLVAVGEDAVYGGDVATGRFEQLVSRDGGPIATAAVATVDGRTVAVFTEGEDETSRLLAVDAETGKEEWDASLEDVSGSGVTIDGDLVFVGDRVGNAYAFDVATGDPAWPTNPKALGGGAIEAPPAAADGRVVFVTRIRDTGDVRVTSLDETDGTEIWHHTTSFAAGTSSAVSIAGDRVFFGWGSELKVHAVSASSGTDVWTARTRSSFSPLSAPAVGEDRLFVISTSTAECAVYAFDLADGSKLWDFQFQEPGIRSSPVVVGDTVYVGLDDGRVVGIDAPSGIEVWEDHTGPGAIGPLAVAGDKLIASKRGSNGGLIAYGHDPDGELLHIESPTTLKLPAVLARFGIAFAAVLAAVLGIALLLRRSGAPVEAAGPGPAETTTEGVAVEEGPDDPSTDEEG